MFWCENLDFGGFGNEKSVFLVSTENGAGVNKMTNITYTCPYTLVSFYILMLFWILQALRTSWNI